jgi:ribosome-associated protein
MHNCNSHDPTDGAKSMAQDPQDPEDFMEDAPPSKSARKRAAHAAQDLGEELTAMRDSDLEGLGLPERITDAIREARRITSRAGLARQRQYIGKLMREIDLEPVRAALAARDEKNAIDAQRFKRLESWRERLITEGPAALDELSASRADFNRGNWQKLISAAAAERARTEASGPASRELFRALRKLFEGE